jgi:hypothetical protein
MVHSTCYLLLFSLLAISSLDAFLIIQSPQYKLKYSVTTRQRGPSTSITLNAQPPRQQSFQERARRQELLSRNGPYFKWNRRTGDIGFGATAQLATQLQNLESDSDSERPNRPDDVAKWLSDSDGRGLALSLWDPDLITDLGNSVYRLQTTELTFITIKLSPSVDVQMWTTTQAEDGKTQPVFSIQSIDYNPNIQLLPGLGVPAEALGVTIEVVGDLRPSEDGTGVIGTISFQSSANLSLPMQLLPEAVLKGATQAVNKIILNFAVSNFQKGAVAKYQEFQQQQQQQEAT